MRDLALDAFRATRRERRGPGPIGNRRVMIQMLVLVGAYDDGTGREQEVCEHELREAMWEVSSTLTQCPVGFRAGPSMLDLDGHQHFRELAWNAAYRLLNERDLLRRRRWGAIINEALGGLPELPEIVA